jgi:voltage-gated potassium channel
MENIKRKVYAIVEAVSYEDLTTPRFDPFDIFIVILIVLNILAVILETVESIYASASNFFRYFETFSIIIFTIEYALRVWTCTLNEQYKNGLIGRIKFIFTPLAIIDLFAFLPFYIPMIIPFDFRFLRGFRLLRLVRVLKIGRYSEAVRLFGRVLKAKKAELLTSVFIIFVLLIISSSLLYYVEREAQPDKFSSIPQAMWWGVVTLTTVGYGDIYPVTPLGKFLSSIISLLGIGLFAMPTGILSAGFVEEIRARKEGRKKCPYCGADLYE